MQANGQEIKWHWEVFFWWWLYICTHQGYLASLACVVSPVIVKLVPFADSSTHRLCCVPCYSGISSLSWLSWTHRLCYVPCYSGISSLCWLSSPPPLDVLDRYNCEDPDCYRDLARLRGVHYMTWENKQKLVQEDEVRLWETTLNGTHTHNTIQYNYITKCQHNCTRNVLWCQVHSSHIHTNHKTLDYNTHTHNRHMPHHTHWNTVMHAFMHTHKYIHNIHTPHHTHWNTVTHTHTQRYAHTRIWYIHAHIYNIYTCICTNTHMHSTCTLIVSEERREDWKGRKEDSVWRIEDSEGRKEDSEGRRFVGEREVSEGRREVSEGRREDSEGRRFVGEREVSEGRREDSEGRRFVGEKEVSEGRREVSEGRREVSEGRREVSEGRREDSEGRREDSEGRREDSEGEKGGFRREKRGFRREKGGFRREKGGFRREERKYSSAGMGMINCVFYRDITQRWVHMPSLPTTPLMWMSSCGWCVKQQHMFAPTLPS